MEAAGLAVGVVGLLALYEEAASRVRSVRHFSSQSLRVTSRYNATKILFERWGNQANAIHPQLKDPATTSAVEDLLRSISDVFETTDSDMARYHDKSSDSVKAHFRSRVKWAAADSKRLSSQVQDFDDLVQKLYSLVPPGDLQNNEFQQLQDALVQSQRTEALNQATHWLDAMTTENTFDAYCSARLDPTCSWIDTHPVYRAWSLERTEKASKILWINGPPGFGKSVLCAYIITSLLSRNNYPVYYFFCSGDSESQRNPISILRAWIHQAMHQDEAILDIVLQYLSSCRNTKATLSDLWQLLKKLMSHSPNAVFAVDGLDECPRSTNRVDLHRSREDILNELLKVSAKAEVRVLVVSRNEGDIRSQLSPHGPQASGIKIYELPITRDLVSSDVTRFATHIVNYKLPTKPSQFNQTLAARMAERGDGMFLFIRLQSQNLRPRKGNSQLERAVDEMPTELPQIYRRNWSNIQNYSESDKQLAEAILRWVTFAQRPLTIAELAEIAAVLGSDDNNRPQFDDLPDPFDRDYVDSEILGLCGSFLELRASGTDTKWETQTVHLIHYSAEEFLVGNSDDAPFMDRPLQHYNLLKCCLTYLNDEATWQYNPCEDRNPIYRRPFLEYAVFKWYSHLRPSEEHPAKLNLQLQLFFGLYNSNWENWRRLYEASPNADSGILDKGGSPGQSSTADPDTLTQSMLGHRFYYAALFGLEEVLRYLHSVGKVDINDSDGLFGNPLLGAVGNGHLSVVRFLLGAGADVNPPNTSATALHVAIAWNQVKIVVELLQHGASISDTSSNGHTSLYIAAGCGSAEIVRILIENGAEISSTDQGGYSPLHLAASSNGADIAKYLLDCGADPTATSNDGRTPLHNAAYWGSHEVAKLLCISAANIAASDKYKETALHLAARNGHYKVVRLLLESGAGVSQHDQFALTPLATASSQGHPEVVKLLVEFGSNMSTVDGDGDTPLSLASYKGHTEVVKLLIELGADVSTRNKAGRTPLHLACLGGHTDAARVLIEAGAAISTLNQDGDTPLNSAAYEGHVEAVKALIEAGGDVDTPDNYGATPLHYAFKHEFENLILILLDNQASLDCLDFRGRSTWQYANAEFRARIPQCEHCKAPSEDAQKQRARLTIQTIAETARPHAQKDVSLLRCLGYCLQRLQDFPSASIILNQTVCGKSEEIGYYVPDIFCNGCDEVIIGRGYSCSVCPDFDICTSCMKQYSEGERFHDCTGHEYLRVPSEDWNPEEMTDVYTQEFVDWLKGLALRYQIDNL